MSRAIGCRVGLVSAVATLLWAAASSAQAGRGTAAPDTAQAGAVRPLRVSGYVQVHFRYAFKTGEDSLVDHPDFRVQRVRVSLEGDLSPKVGYNVEIDPRAPEITGVLRDAYVTLRVIPRHQIRIGQQKTQFGYENRVSSTELFTVNRAEVSDFLSRGINLRDVGVGLIGNLKLGKGARFEDALTVVNGAGMNVQADDTKQKNVWGRVGLRLRNDRTNSLTRFGISGGKGDFIDLGDPLDPTDDFRLEFKRYGADLELENSLGFLSAEYAGGDDRNVTADETDQPLGWYVNFAGKTRWNAGPVIRFDNSDDKFRRWTLGAYFGLPAAPLRFLVNYEYRRMVDEVRADDKLYFWTQVRF